MTWWLEREAIRAIQALVADAAGLRVEDLIGPSTTREISAARSLAAALCSDLVRRETMTTIGDQFGYRSHSFVSRAVQRWNKNEHYAGMRLLAKQLEEVRML